MSLKDRYAMMRPSSEALSVATDMVAWCPFPKVKKSRPQSTWAPITDRRVIKPHKPTSADS